MNLIDAVVTKILSKPVYKSQEGYSWWIVRIEYKDMGGKSTKKRVFSSEEEAKKLKVGDVFQH